MCYPGMLLKNRICSSSSRLAGGGGAWDAASPQSPKVTLMSWCPRDHTLSAKDSEYLYGKCLTQQSRRPGPNGREMCGGPSTQWALGRVGTWLFPGPPVIRVASTSLLLWTWLLLDISSLYICSLGRENPIFQLEARYIVTKTDTLGSGLGGNLSSITIHH